MSRAAIPSAAMTTTTSINPRCSRMRERRDPREHRRLQVECQRIEGIPAEPAGVLFLHLTEQHMQREPDRQVEDDADHGRGDGGERAGQPLVGAQLLDERRTGENP